MKTTKKYLPKRKTEFLGLNLKNNSFIPQPKHKHLYLYNTNNVYLFVSYLVNKHTIKNGYILKNG